MVKLAHIAIVTPHRCGLYETTRELVVALRKVGIDSRIYDPKPKEGMVESRESAVCDLDWAKSADLLINHSGLGENLEASTVSVIHVAHGRPRSSFLLEAKGGTPIYSHYYHKSRDKRWKAVVTFWPEHKPYLEVMWPDTPVRVVQAPVDLDAWTPNGPNGYNWHGKGGKINVVCTDAWRDDIDPFPALNAFALFARQVSGAKLHIYGASKNTQGWAPLLKRIQDDGNLGEVRRQIKGLAHVYRAADMLISPHTIYTRAIREAMACGCPVVRVNGSLYHTVSEMRLLPKVGWNSHKQARMSAESRFNPAKTATEFRVVVDEVINDGLCK